MVQHIADLQRSGMLFDGDAVDFFPIRRKEWNPVRGARRSWAVAKPR